MSHLRVLLVVSVCVCVLPETLTNIVSNYGGLKLGFRYYEIMGPLGQGKGAFEEKEEEEKEIADKKENDDNQDFEFEIQKEEENYDNYKEQMKIAKLKGKDPKFVPEPIDVKDFEDKFNVDATSEIKSKFRRKRLAVEDSNRYWTNATVPYIFAKTIKGEDVMAKIRAKSRFHYWTCVRFVPWTKFTKQQYGLDHDNYLMHIEKNGCWSFVGNMKMEGQKISCCRDTTCVHELGHALGLHHEQKSPLHDDYLRVNQKNIEPGKISGYDEIEPVESRTFGYFDMASTMLYNKYAFSNNGMPTMTVFDSRMEYLMNNPDPHMFYMFKEITSMYKCKEMYCRNFGTDCKEGYVAFVRGKCTCRCPQGLDPESGCTAVYHADKHLKSLSWSGYRLSMLKPQDGCPIGFEDGKMIQYVKNAKFSEPFNMDIKYDNAFVDLIFCTITKTSSAPDAIWEPGQYCIFSDNGVCPKGFEDGYVQFSSGRSNVIHEPVPDGKYSDNTVWHFCCREDGSWKDPMYLPTSQPFSLFPKDNECQEVKDMKSELQWMKLVNDDSVSTAGSVPNVRITQKNYFVIGVCYYWPIDYDCGGIINLNAKNRVAVITSPNFPQDYNNKQECTWTIRSPEHTNIKLEFEKFDIETSVSEDTGFPNCADSLEIRSTLPGNPGISYCGSSFKQTIISEVNNLGLTLSTGQTGTRSGFKAVVRLITERKMCYTNKGEDYRGTVNVTRLFEPCLPWSKVQHCPHHAFSPVDLDDDLVDNFCRNPGSGTKPWCYTHYEDCNRNYCDPCQLENCYDVLEDCLDLISSDPSFCKSNTEAQRICRQTCGYCSTEKIKSVSRTRCSTPPELKDATQIGRIKKRYKVSHTMEYQCKASKETETRVCLAGGTWSGGNFVCGRCPTGWIPFKKKCYKWFESYDDWKSSNDVCQQFSSVVAPAKDFDEYEFLLKLRRDVRSFWIGLQYDDSLRNNIWIEDGTPITFNKFVSGSRQGCAYIDKSGSWIGVSCDSALYLGVICKLTPSERATCIDGREDCQEFIRQEPGACEAYVDFAWHVCPQSCNLCNNGADISCKLPPRPPTVTMVTNNDILHPGEMVEYKCKDGFILVSGDLRRACLLKGILTGNEPVCLENELVPTPNNEVELRQRSFDGMDGVSYLADNGALKIHKTGKLIRWVFYSVYNGEVALQVWRKTNTENRYQLIGQNKIANTGNHRTRSIEIPYEDQIDVTVGDTIGFYLPVGNKGGITFDKCVTEYTFGDFGNQMVVKEKVQTSAEWRISGIYDTREDKMDCKIISLRAFVL